MRAFAGASLFIVGLGELYSESMGPSPNTGLWSSALSVPQRRLVVPSSSADSDFASFLDRYAAGELLIGSLQQGSTLELQRQLRRVASSWVGPKDATGTARRRLAVATLSLEIIHESFETAWRRGFSGDLLEWSCDLLREVPPTDAERAWHLAAVALLERASAFRLIRGPVSVNGNSAFVTHIIHAERRFPDDGRWVLARALDAEHGVWPPALDEDILHPLPDAEDRIRSQLRAAFERSDVAAEAHLRWGYFQVRRGRLNEALQEFDAVGHPDDRALLYWVNLFRGRTLLRLKRPADAAASYRLALSAFPAAQSATLALTSVLTREGGNVEANEALARMFRAGPVDDPWHVYGYPSYRHWRALLQHLRQSMAP